MNRRDLGDVVVRARGLARHLLDTAQLRQLSRASGSGALAASLQDLGYWPAPTAGGEALTAADVVERAIDHETLSRLGTLVRWLAGRVAPFAPLFEIEVRDALRIRIRELADAAPRALAPARAAANGWPALRELRRAASGAPDHRALVRALGRIASPYAPALADALRRHGDDPRALELALDTTWTTRARAATARGPAPLRRWLEDEIDLRNAWTALFASGPDAPFIEGGRSLPMSLQRSLAAAPEAPARRRLLARAFRETPLAGVFDDPDLPVSGLEARAQRARIAAARHAARLDPIGAAPILEVVLRLRAERADLRCIGWGVASGLGVDAIVSRLGYAA